MGGTRLRAVADIGTYHRLGLAEAELTPDAARQIARLTSLPRFNDRFVIPPYRREEQIQQTVDPQQHKYQVGFGFINPPRRGL